MEFIYQHLSDNDPKVVKNIPAPWNIWVYSNGSVSKPCTPGEHQNSW
jgi:hypothetical protein